MTTLTNHPKRLAHLCGLAYLIIIVCGITAEFLIRGPITVSGDTAATAANLLAHSGLFRAGILLEVIMAFADIAVVALFLVLLWPVNRLLALAAALFHLIQTAILGANLITSLAALAVLTGAPSAAFEQSKLEALSAFFFSLHGQGYSLALFFFGVNCILLGVLVIRSLFLPSLIGTLMIAAGASYLITSTVRFIAPDNYGTVMPLLAICLVSELSIALWLTIRGLNAEKWRAMATQ